VLMHELMRETLMDELDDIRILKLLYGGYDGAIPKHLSSSINDREVFPILK